MIRIMTVMDNLAGEQELLHNEPALSFYITIKNEKNENETNATDTRLLFDFGAGQTTLENARLLNVPLKKINFAVASHGHYDHGNGYPFFVEAGLRCPLVTGHGYFREKYELRGESAGYIGINFDQEWLKENNLEHYECNGVLKLAEGLHVVGPIERTSRHDFETIPKRFVMRDTGKWVQDFFTDEICLAIDTPKGLVLVVGCSHPGILTKIAEKSPASIGGGMNRPSFLV